MIEKISTRTLLNQLADGQIETPLTLDGLLDQFRTRAFGIFLLISVLPAFVPLPAGGGAITGPLCIVLGLQMLFLMAHPWLPKRISAKHINRSHLKKLRDRFSPWLFRLEKISRPRWEILFDNLAARLFNGAMILILGILIALPIPLTNYPFGLILLVYCIAMIERDGIALSIAWVLGLAQIVFCWLLLDQMIVWVSAWFA